MVEKVGVRGLMGRRRLGDSGVRCIGTRVHGHGRSKAVLTRLGISFFSARGLSAVCTCILSFCVVSGVGTMAISFWGSSMKSFIAFVRTYIHADMHTYTHTYIQP